VTPDDGVGQPLLQWSRSVFFNLSALLFHHYRNDKEIALDALRTMEERREALEQRRGREIEREQTHDRGFGLSR
jgi:hypothetical protein